jgi:uncharacterized protein
VPTFPAGSDPTQWGGGHDPAALLRVILAEYTLRVFGHHGVVHWARVLENGLAVAERSGADRDVVMLFALFHDARRLNEWDDEGHGLRGAMLARSLRGTLVHLDAARFELLYEACRLHTEGHTEADVTIQTCWDADRLDLGRVGITPEPSRLCTPAARRLIRWADARAVEGHVPTHILTHWEAPLDAR